jgi:hypothetical protein
VWYGLELWRLAQDFIGSCGREWSYVCSVYFVAIGAISLLSFQDWVRWILVDCSVGEAEESHPRPINVMLQNATLL